MKLGKLLRRKLQGLECAHIALSGGFFFYTFYTIESKNTFF